jgi:hypothetical protein
MAADWHPADGFDTPALCLFISTAYVSCMGHIMANRNIFNIGHCVIKQCCMYAKKYKAWITRKTASTRIIETFDTFKTFWAAKFMLVNQMAVPASMHSYGMAAGNNDHSIVSYDKSIANFGATYTTTQEFVKSQGSRIASMQGQLWAMQQYCMTLQ